MKAAQERLSKLATWLTVAALTWGAVAFGAVYPWAYWPLAGMSILAGLAGLLADPQQQAQGGAVSAGLVTGLISVAAVIGLQLVPLPLSVLTAINPDGVVLLRQLHPLFALDSGSHPLSIWPEGTGLALALFCCLTILLVGTAAHLSPGGVRRLTELLLITGVLVALIGIIQKPLYTGRIYGFWVTEQGGTPFGPFVNRNHFAGWMMMVLPLGLGYMGTNLARAMRGVKPDWRHRLLWLSTRDANKLIASGMAVIVMTLALVLTTSRSGIGGAALAVAVMAYFGLRRLESPPKRIFLGAFLLLVVAAVLGWAGVDNIAVRFSEQGWAGITGRSGGWADAVATFERHWITGTGLNTYQVSNLVYQQHDTKSFMSSAHNDYLQLAAEGGLLVLVPVAACLALFVRDVRSRFRQDGASSSYWLRAGAVAGLLAIGFQELVDFSLQIPANAALFAVVCAVALHKPFDKAVMTEYPRAIA